MKLTLEDLVHATGGRCLNVGKNGDKLITSITTDTRQITEGSLFIPLRGNRFDGHNYIEEAFKKGACMSLTENPNQVTTDQTIIWVASTHKALLDLAQYYRKQFKLPIIAVTGSVGKTTTKDLIAAVLSKKYNTLKTEGNFNNEIGMPLTVFRLEDHHECAVVELGMNHFGEIERLSRALLPDIAVITNIGVAHIENLGSQEGILKAKLEILEGLKAQGPLIINGDDVLLQTVASKEHPLITYGRASKHSYFAEGYTTKDNHMMVQITTPKASYPVIIPALGEHMMYNGLVAVAIAEHLGLTKEEILEGLMTYKPSQMRMNIETSPQGVTLINDAYNASPDSMKASLKVLNDYEAKGRRIAVLGDMFEMGEHGPKLHEEVGAFIAELDLDTLYTVGPLARLIAEKAEAMNTKRLKCQKFDTKEQCIKVLQQTQQQGDIILLKASRGMAFEEIANAIRKVNNNE